MSNSQDLKVQRMQKVMDAFSEDLITYEEVKALLDTLIDFVREAREDLETLHDSREGSVATALNGLLKAIDAAEARLKAQDAITKKDAQNEVQKLSKRLDKELKKIRDDMPDMPDMPEMPNLNPIYAHLESIEDRLKPSAEEIRDLLETLEGDERLDVSAIRGLEELIAQAQAAGKEVRVGSAGGGRGFFIFIDGVKKGIIKELNFAAGTAMSIAYSEVNGRPTLTFNSSGGSGSGVNVETPPESPDAVNTVFTVSAQPQWVVSDGTTYFEGQGYSYAALAITMDIPPSATIRVIT